MKASNIHFFEKAIDVLGIMLNNAKLFFIIVIVPTVIMMVYVLLVTPRYNATSTVLPAVSSSFDRFSPVNALLSGMISSGAQDGVYSTYYYPSIIRSRRILDGIINEEFSFIHKGKKFQGTYMQFYNEEDREAAIRDLRDRLKTATDFDTGILSVSIETENPYFSAQVIGAIVTELDRFNSSNRIEQAERSLEFTESRFNKALDEYQKVEQEYVEFVSRQRAANLSPRAEAERARLISKREIHKNIFLTLLERRELNYHETINNTPVLTILDSAEVIYERSFPKRKNMVLVTLFLSIMFSFATVMLKHTFEVAYQNLPAEKQVELKKNLNNCLDLRHLWRKAMSKS